MMMNGAEVCLEVLREHNVDVVFGYPGGAVLPLYDALFKQTGIRHVLVRHEQAAVHAAEGYARSTGKTGVVLVTSGPGATNTVTGLADAMMDGIPIVCITGQVASHLIGTDAFQEADIIGITRSVTKHNYMAIANSGSHLAYMLHQAFLIAETGRPGPVLIDIPKDVQLGPAEYQNGDKYVRRFVEPVIVIGENSFEESISIICNILRTAQRPVIYAGGGLVSGGPAGCELLRQVAETFNCPVTTTLLGLGVFPGDHELSLGMLGMHGTLEANMSMHGCDVMLALAARFDDRITGRTADFSPDSFKIHVDIARHNIGKIIKPDIGIVCDAERFLSALLSEAGKTQVSFLRTPKWNNDIEEWKSRRSLMFRQLPDSAILPQHAISTVGRLLIETATERNTGYRVTTDVGQHQMWAAQHIPFREPGRWMTSGGLGTMGYGLPAAVGVQIAWPNDMVACISGDASVQMNIQELATVRENNLPVKLFVINNGCMGMVRQWQQRHHGTRYSQSIPSFMPDLVMLAGAYGIHGMRVDKPENLESVVKEALCYPGPCVVDIVVEALENCYPMIPSGAAHNEIILNGEE